MMLKTKNKKADVAINLLVVLVLVTAVSALFIFLTNTINVKEDISVSRTVQEVNFQKQQMEENIDYFGEIAVIETYKDFLIGSGENDYILNRQTKNGVAVFSQTPPNLDERFRKRFVENFKKNFLSQKFENEELEEIKEMLKDNKFSSSMASGVLYLKFEEVIFSSPANPEISVMYNSKIETEFNLDNLGLHSFQKIEKAKNNFKVDGNLESLKSELFNFEVGISEGVISLKSKKEFFINGDFGRIGFSFLYQ